jgi:hypothetical protein
MLTDDSMRAATVVSSWSEFPELIPTSKIIQVFQEKHKRLGKQKKQQAEKDSDDEVISTDAPGDVMELTD